MTSHCWAAMATQCSWPGKSLFSLEVQISRSIMWTRDAAEPPCGGKFTSLPSLIEFIRFTNLPLRSLIFGDRQNILGTVQNLIRTTDIPPCCVAGGGSDWGSGLPVPGVCGQSGWAGTCIQTLRRLHLWGLDHARAWWVPIDWLTSMFMATQPHHLIVIVIVSTWGWWRPPTFRRPCLRPDSDWS